MSCSSTLRKAHWRLRRCGFSLTRARRRRFGHSLAGHVVETAFECGWSSLKNGELIEVAEQAGFAVFVTTD